MNHEPLGTDILYPSDPKQLRDTVESALDHAGKHLEMDRQDRRVIIIPHGWYDYIASVMAFPWKAVSSFEAERIVLLLPVHGEGRGISTPPCRELNSPLGTHPVEQAPEIPRDTACWMEEPALDNALPFITCVFPGIPILPVFMNGSSSRDSRKLSALLSALDTPSTLYAVSSSLTGHVPVSQGSDQAARVLSLLCTDAGDYVHQPLLEPLKRQEISPCNTGALEAVRRSGVLAGPYTLLSRGETPESSGRSTHFAGCIG